MSFPPLLCVAGPRLSSSAVTKAHLTCPPGSLKQKVLSFGEAGCALIPPHSEPCANSSKEKGAIWAIRCRPDGTKAWTACQNLVELKESLHGQHGERNSFAVPGACPDLQKPPAVTAIRLEVFWSIVNMDEPPASASAGSLFPVRSFESARLALPVHLLWDPWFAGTI